MPDQRFHFRASSFTLGQVAEMTGATPGKGADPDFVIKDIAPIDSAGPEDLTFLDNPKYKVFLSKTKAGACFVRPEFADLAPKGLRLLLTEAPYKAFARAAQRFYPEPWPEPRIAPNATINAAAQVGDNCVIEENAVIFAGARIGNDCWIEANSVIGANVQIGDRCRIGPGASVSHAIIGDHVRLYAGVRVGQDGFGFAPDPAGPVKTPQAGRVVIGNNVEIGANSCVDRGSGPDTIIGDGTWIDNLVQIAHNVTIGRSCIVAAQSGISGSAVIEDFVVMGGQVGVSGHLRIGKGARIAAKSGVTKDVPPGQDYMGYPALPMRQYLKGVALLNRLIKREKSS